MKSKEQHIIDGTYRPDRHEDILEYAQLQNIPEPPEDFSQPESVYWYSYAISLKETGSLCEVYLTTLSDLCRWEHIKDELTKAVELVSGNNINRTLNDAIKASDMVMKLRSKLGVTPVDKSKVKSVPVDFDDGFDDL